MRSSGSHTPIRPMSMPRPRLVVEPRPEALPPCPAVMDGVAVRYMGTERRRIEGEVSGFVYHVDPARRLFEVDRRDLPGVLNLRAFVRAD